MVFCLIMSKQEIQRQRFFNALRFFAATMLLILISISGCKDRETPNNDPPPDDHSSAIPDRGIIRCKTAQEIWAARSNFSGGPLIDLEMMGLPESSRNICGWISATKNRKENRKNSTVDFTESLTPEKASVVLSGKDQALKALALYAWRKNKWTASEQLLLPPLSNPDPDVAVQALLLVQDRNLRTMSGEVIALAGSPTADVRMVAAETLGVIGDEKAAPTLINILKDPDAFVRYKASWALGMLRIKSAVKPLTRALSDPDFNVIRQSAWSLGQIGDHACLPHLWKTLGSKDEYVRSTAASALSGFAQPGNTDALAGSFKRLGKTRKIAACAQLTVQNEDAVFNAVSCPELPLSTEKSDDVENRKKQAKDYSDVQKLIALLGDPDSEVSREAAASLGLLGDKAAVEPLIQAYEKCDPGTKAMILSALALIDDPGSRPVFTRAVLEKDTDLLNRGLIGLALCGAPEDAALAAPFLDHPDERIRASAAMAMGTLVNRDYIVSVRNHIADPSDKVRFYIVDALILSLSFQLCGDFKILLKKGSVNIKVAASRAMTALECSGQGADNPDEALEWYNALRRLSILEGDVVLRKMWHGGSLEAQKNFSERL